MNGQVAQQYSDWMVTLFGLCATVRNGVGEADVQERRRRQPGGLDTSRAEDIAMIAAVSWKSGAGGFGCLLLAALLHCLAIAMRIAPRVCTLAACGVWRLLV